MELTERLTRFPWGTLSLSATLTGAAAVAIFASVFPPDRNAADVLAWLSIR